MTFRVKGPTSVEAAVKTALDSNNLPEPSKEALARLDAIGEAEIDYSDIPELDERFFKKATNQVSQCVWIPIWWNGSNRKAKPIRPV